jgi:hypothetical protein
MHRKVDRLPVDAALAGPHRLWSPQHFRSLCEDPAIWRLQLDYLLSKTKLSTLMQPRRIVWTTLILLLILPGLAGAQRRDATQVLIGQPAPKQVATLTDQLATVQSAMQAMADQLKRIGGQIETLQKQVDAFPKNPALSPQQTEIQSQLAARKAELDTTSQALAKAASELANADLDERRDLFDLVKEIFLIAGGIGGTGIAIFEVYYRLVIRKTRANLEQSIRSQILKETLITTGGTFARISIPWWSQCEPDFDAYLKSVYLRGGLPAGQAPFLSEIRLARSLTDQGFDFFDTVLREAAESEEAVRYMATLYNQWIYYRTAELLCAGAPISAADTDAVLDRAEQCLGFSENSKVGGFWYELRQTVAFAFLVLGDARFNPTSPRPQLLQRGRALLQGLFAGRRPVPRRRFQRAPTPWLQEIYDEVFPVNPATNARVDVFGLGAIPRP